MKPGLWWDLSLRRAGPAPPHGEASPAASANSVLASGAATVARGLLAAERGASSRQLLNDRARPQPEILGHLTFAVPFGCMISAP